VPNEHAEKISEDSIGSIYCNYESLISKLDEQNHVELDYQPFRVLQLKNKNTLIGSFNDNLIRIYDYEFNLIRKYDQINGQTVQPGGLTSDMNGNIFVVNCLNATINKLDSQFGFMKSFREPNNQIYTDIHAYHDRLYACTTLLKTIAVFNLDLEPVSIHYLDYVPFQIRVLKNRACVIVKDNKKNWNTYMYKLPDFEIIAKDIESGSILAHNDMFYIHTRNELRIFDKNGKFIDKRLKSFGKKQYYLNVGLEMAIDHEQLSICLDKAICRFKAY
jgi:hypothetical protein